MSTALSRLAELAKADSTQRFLSLAHLLTPEALMQAFRHLRKDASAGVDHVTYADYDGNATGNIQQLHDRLTSHRYRAQPLRRVYIPKEQGTQRPISIPALEDKIVQRATVEVLNAGRRLLSPSLFGWVKGWRFLSRQVTSQIRPGRRRSTTRPTST